MHSDEMQSNSVPSPVPSQPVESGVPSLSVTEGARPGFRLPFWLLTLGVGLGAGLISWAGGEAMFNIFRIEDEVIYPANYKQISGYQKQAVTSQIRGEARIVVERKKAAVTFGLLGLVLGVSLGLTGGLASGSARTAVLGAVVGGLAGTAAGGGLSLAFVPLFFRYQNPESGLIVLFLTHAGIFVGIGAASGLALGLGLGDRPALGEPSLEGCWVPWSGPSPSRQSTPWPSP